MAALDVSLHALADKSLDLTITVFHVTFPVQRVLLPNCVACKTGYIFVSGTSGACISSCPAGQYSTGTACASCHAGCSLCYGSSSTATVSSLCTSCKNDGTDDYFKVVNADACAKACPDGQYQGSVAHTCSLCDISCATCDTTPTDCLTCKNGYIFVSGTSGPCINSCPVGKYMGSTACTACPDGCKTCFGGGVDSNGDGI
jgi:proprotein convertase subtilisin/kexin type 5